MSVGIDIGSKSIKVIELTRDGDLYSLKSAGIIGLKTESQMASTQDGKTDPELLSSIKKLFSDAKISGKNVSIAISESQAFTRVVKFPLLTDQEIESAIKWEAEGAIPIPLNEAIIQHQILERRENITPPEVSVLLVAAPKVAVERYVKILSEAGLNVVGIETELLSLTRALAPASQTVVLVDFGAKSTDIAIARNGLLVFSRTIPTAGEAFTRAIAQSLGVATTQAEEYKKTYGLTSGQLEGKVSGALAGVFNVITEEIKKTIHFYQTEEKGEVPSSIILSGGSSELPQVAPMLTKLVGIEVDIANPFAKVKIDPAYAKTLTAYAPLYSVAVGLALRGD